MWKKNVLLSETHHARWRFYEIKKSLLLYIAGVRGTFRPEKKNKYTLSVSTTIQLKKKHIDKSVKMRWKYLEFLFYVK